ncbi:MAG: hypothetical protein LBR80_15710 [Deltaproteobacteria bacterium]|jgi:hypothetical protein|nr:hypothetical protein [Deltaproteobacteria bacterium]
MLSLRRMIWAAQAVPVLARLARIAGLVGLAGLAGLAGLTGILLRVEGPEAKDGFERASDGR